MAFGLLQGQHFQHIPTPKTANDIRATHEAFNRRRRYTRGILYNDRILIPPSRRNKILKALHSAHQGISQMCSRADASFLWPSMNSAISEMRIRCAACNRNAPSQPSALPTPPIQPQYPFQCICADFF